MILRSLVALAEREELLGDRGFVAMPVHWAIDINREGRVLNVRYLGEKPEGEKKERFPVVPIPKRRSRGGLKVEADLLVDKGMYVLGLGKPREPENRGRLGACQAAMIQDVAKIVEQTEDEGAAAQWVALQTIRDDPESFGQIWTLGNAKAIRVPQGADHWMDVDPRWAENHLIGFFMGDQAIWRRPGVRSWVAATQDEVAPTGEEGTFCLVNGGRVVPVETHPQFDLPGDTGRLPLVSFNCQAFEHQGLLRNENAPIGRVAANAYFMALNRLLARGTFRHPITNEPMSRRNYRLTDDTTVLYWSDESQHDPLDDMAFDEFLGGGEETIRRIPALYKAPRSGRPPLVEDITPIHTLVLTRVKSRVVVRTADTHTVGSVASSILAYLDDLSIIPRVAGEREHRGLWSLLESTTHASSESSTVAPDLATRLLRCALDSRVPFPRELLAVILRRIRAHDKRGVSTARAALLKAVLNRTCKSELPKELTVSLSPDYPSPAYQLGRLFAVLEKIQTDALGDLNATIADRFIGSAMGSPALAFPRLLKMSHHHLGKLEKDKPGLARNHSRLLDEILSHVPPEFPKVLELADQGTFMVGYHHQRADLWTSKKIVIPTETATTPTDDTP